MDKKIGVFLYSTEPQSKYIQDVRSLLDNNAFRVVGPTRFPESNDWKTATRIRETLHDFSDICVIDSYTFMPLEGAMLVIGISTGLGIPVALLRREKQGLPRRLDEFCPAVTQPYLVQHLNDIGPMPEPVHVVPAEEGCYTDDDDEKYVFKVVKRKRLKEKK